MTAAANTIALGELVYGMSIFIAGVVVGRAAQYLHERDKERIARMARHEARRAAARRHGAPR